MFLAAYSLFILFGFSEAGVTPWWNYPGLELWKFANLAIFIACALYLHRRFGRPIREALRARSEGIKLELHRAREERDQALAKLAEVEARFQNLDTEVSTVKEKAHLEAEAEKMRLEAATQAEIAKIREQAKREIESAGKAARHELRRFAAQESVRLAEEILEKEIRPEDDARLTSLTVNELGRART
ncbi:MAG TPA: ATP synthase F0 subunit B [Pyrinomonadaceae bacterium]|nr:ATP synthase F0 subunit B [Pyrinomonadaceae bacterium]